MRKCDRCKTNDAEVALQVMLPDGNRAQNVEQRVRHNCALAARFQNSSHSLCRSLEESGDLCNFHLANNRQTTIYVRPKSVDVRAPVTHFGSCWATVMRSSRRGSKVRSMQSIATPSAIWPRTSQCTIAWLREFCGNFCQKICLPYISVMLREGAASSGK